MDQAAQPQKSSLAGRATKWSWGKAKDFAKGEAQAHWSRRGQRRAPREPRRESGFQKGLGEYKGRAKAAIQVSANPWGRAILAAIFYTFFSVWPIDFLPVLSYVWYIWGMLFIWAVTLAFSRKIHPDHRKMGPVILLIIAFLLFNLGPVLGLYAISDIYAENLGISITNPIKQWYSSYFTSISDFSDVKSAEEVPIKGVHFEPFSADEAFEEGEFVTISAEAVVDGILDEDTGNYPKRNIFFSCYEQEPDGTKKTEGKVYTQFNPEKPDKILPVPQQAKTTFYITCTFEDGLQIDEITARIVNAKDSKFKWKTQEGIELNNLRISPKGIVLEAQTSYSQVSSLKLYNIQEKNKPENIIDTIRANDGDMDSEGMVSPVCESGCGSPYRLSLTTGVQPLTENKRLKLTTELLKDQRVFGILMEISSLSLVVPEGVELQNTPAPCDFDISDDGEDQFPVLLDEKLKLINKKIAASTTAQREDKTIAPRVKFTCHYNIPEPSETWTYKLLKGRIAYEVIVRGRAPIEIYRELPFGEETTKEEITNPT